VRLRKSNDLLGVLGKTDGLWVVNTNFNSSYYFPLKIKGCTQPVVIEKSKSNEFDILAYGRSSVGYYEIQKYIINYKNKTSKLGWTIPGVDPSNRIMGFSDKNGLSFISFLFPINNKESDSNLGLGIFNAQTGLSVLKLDIKSDGQYGYPSPYYYDNKLIILVKNKIFVYRLNHL